MIRWRSDRPDRQSGSIAPRCAAADVEHMLARFERKPLKQSGVKIRRGIGMIDLDPLFEQIAGPGAIGSIVGTHDIFPPADAEKGNPGRPFGNRRPQNQIFQKLRAFDPGWHPARISARSRRDFSPAICLSARDSLGALILLRKHPKRI